MKKNSSSSFKKKTLQLKKLDLFVANIYRKNSPNDRIRSLLVRFVDFTMSSSIKNVPKSKFRMKTFLATIKMVLIFFFFFPAQRSEAFQQHQSSVSNGIRQRFVSVRNDPVSIEAYWLWSLLALYF